MTHDFTKVPVADTYLSRLRGLIGRGGRSSVFIPRCSSIHTWFLSASIDVVWVDDSSIALEVKKSVAPWRVCFGPKGTRSVLELPAGDAREISAGDSIRILPAG